MFDQNFINKRLKNELNELYRNDYIFLERNIEIEKLNYDQYNEFIKQYIRYLEGTIHEMEYREFLIMLNNEDSVVGKINEIHDDYSNEIDNCKDEWPREKMSILYYNYCHGYPSKNQLLQELNQIEQDIEDYESLDTIPIYEF